VVAPPPLLPVEGYFPAQAYQELLERARRDAEVGLDRAPRFPPGRSQCPDDEMTEEEAPGDSGGSSSVMSSVLGS
jgi:hypothetical protein